MQAQQNETVSAVLPGRLYKAHTPYTRENDHALIIIFERRHRGCYYGFAPCLSRSPLHGASLDYLFFISLPASSHPKLYLGSVSFIRKRSPGFPTLYRRVGWIVVNRLLFYPYESMLRLLFNWYSTVIVPKNAFNHQNGYKQAMNFLDQSDCHSKGIGLTCH